MQHASEASPPIPLACLNCGQPLPSPRPRFCPACGQETTLRPPRLGEFVQQFGGAYFATEGALWRTLRLLLLQPGELTRQYLAGRRRHYVLPLRLYLTVSLVALVLMRLLADTDIHVVSDAAPGDAPVDIRIGSLGGSAGMRDGVFHCDGYPAWVCRRLKRRIDVEPRILQRELAATGERMVGNIGAAMFVVLPAFALWLKLVYLNRRMRYTEHLVFALHLHAFWFLGLILLLPGWIWLSGVATLGIVVYPLLAMKRVYGGRLRWRLLRALALIVLYGATLMAALAGLLMWALLT